MRTHVLGKGDFHENNDEDIRYFTAGVFGCSGFASTGLSAEPIYIALSAPLTGTYAEYGQNFKKAMTLGLEWINADGGINGRPIELVIGDSKGDPKESAALAQKFTSDKRIVAELGDFTSTSCLAAQPIYQRAGMVQPSPTSSHPSFAPGSPWSFGIIGTQAGHPCMSQSLRFTTHRMQIQSISLYPKFPKR